MVTVTVLYLCGVCVLCAVCCVVCAVCCVLCAVCCVLCAVCCVVHAMLHANRCVLWAVLGAKLGFRQARMHVHADPVAGALAAAEQQIYVRGRRATRVSLNLFPFF